LSNVVRSTPDTGEARRAETAPTVIVNPSRTHTTIRFITNLLGEERDEPR
jgi:hypothetical protein